MSLREHERRQRQREASELRPSFRVMSIREWCDLNGFSVPTGRRIIASGQGPKVLQLGERRIGIREDHNAEWQESRIRDSA